MDISSRAVITHFDGDPFTIYFWLSMYEKYWRGEVNKIYTAVTYHPEYIDNKVLAYEKELFSRYPEIEVEFSDQWEIPEIVNERVFGRVREELVGFIESDGFVFKEFMVERCFRALEIHGYDVVAANYQLLPTQINGWDGLMRCFFFAKRELLSSIEMSFLPRNVDGVDLDCFGWISKQILDRGCSILKIPDNCLHPSKNIQKVDKYLHIRQMSSSALGMGGGEYGKWLDGSHRVDPVPSGSHEEWVYRKAIAFKKLFWEAFPEKGLLPEFCSVYIDILNNVERTLNIGGVEEMKNHYGKVLKP